MYYRSSCWLFPAGTRSDRVCKKKGTNERTENVLVIGASNGYGLASSIVSAFACGSATLGVALEKQGKGNRTGTVAFSYIGPPQTNPIYRDGTIRKAKQHLEKTAERIQHLLDNEGGRAFISVNKALVSRASAVIPAVPLYISLLYRVMKKKGIHENCIEQMDRLFRNYLYSSRPISLDDSGRIRLDDLEMCPDVQQEVARLWNRINTDNLESLSDIQGFRDEFLRHHGFGIKDVDYTEKVEV